MVVSNALLADFPQLDPLGTSVPGTQGKISEYVTIEKRIFITGCPENKCENPAFPIEAEYSIIIRPKDNFTISLTNATDTLRVIHSDKAWEEEGKTPPNIPDKEKTLDDLAELYTGMTIGPGEEFAFSYKESFDEKYNHAIIINNFELAFHYNDPETDRAGDNNAITGEVIYVGNYSQGAGCWPTSGRITQLPGGDYSHLGSDAFDIGNIEGTPIYSPFAGQACTAGLDSAIYGNYVVLQTSDGSRFSFGHMRSKPFSGCKTVEPGAFLGSMGTTGASSGNHLHFGLIGGFHGSSVLATMMPGGTAVREDDHVRTCYDGDSP
jgi:murein DD-endopeptidase MepM/ murein hydrolase activator NlpD